MTSPSPLEAEAVLFSALLEAAADAIIVIDEIGTVRQANSACAKVFGYELPEIIGRNVGMLMPDRYRREHDGYLHRYLNTGESNIIGVGRQVEGRRSDGTEFPMDLSVGEGHFSGERLYVGIVRDLTERHELLEALREQQAELRQMMDSAVVSTGLIDGHGTLLEANEALRKFLNVETVEGLCLIDYLQSQEGSGKLAASLRALSDGPTVYVLPLLTFGVGSKTRTADLYLASFPQRDSHKRGHGIVAQLVDRTAQVEAKRETRETRAELAHYQRVSTLSAMTAGIAHEVNQPMGAIANYAEAGRNLLRKGDVPKERLEKLFLQIAGQTERAADVIRRLRALAGGYSPARELTNPRELIADSLHLYRSQLDFERLRLNADVSADLPTISVDRVQIQQVLLNLLQNAADSMKDTLDPAITVRASQNEEGVVFYVEDRGTGVAAEIAEHLTRPFFTSKPEGMGIGLTVCRAIVEKHGGRLWFENNSHGVGTTFLFLIPEAKGDMNAST